MNKKGLAPLILRITYSNDRKEIATGFFISPGKWDAIKGKVSGKSPEALQVNYYIDQTKVNLMEIFRNALMEGDIYLESIVSKFLGKENKNMTLSELVKVHNDQFKTRIGTDYSASTFKKYQVTAKRIEEFLRITTHKQDIRLKDITTSFIGDFNHFLRVAYSNGQNTAAKHCKNLKKLVNWAVIHNWMDKSPFTGFKTPYKETKPVYLSQVELDTLQNKIFAIKRLELVKDLFIFQCYTGLAFADMAKLTTLDISIGVDGGKWIIVWRKKTGQRSSIPLLPPAISIIEKYQSDSPKGDKLLPCYSNQKYNSYLHEIAEICGINKSLTSHVGRRTFATTVALANGVPIEIISKILGHSSIRMTQIYAIVTDLNISKEMNRLGNIL